MSDLLMSQKTEAEIAKLLAETSYINNQNRWYSWVVIAGVITALLAAGKYLL